MVDQISIICLDNSELRVEIAPEVGGRITSLWNKALGGECLWRNPRLSLAKSTPGAPYDPHFYGGIDEILPGDLPETVQGLENSDHGELWTLPLRHRLEGKALEMEGMLPRWGLAYRKSASLREEEPILDLDYTIANPTGERRPFLWKLHAALAIQPGDRLVCPARQAAVADPEWSWWKSTEPFPWPGTGGWPDGLVPPPNGTTEFLFLYPLLEGWIALASPARRRALRISFDRQVFPYACYFASFGGLDGHYTAVLEPCTAMPVSVNEALRLGQCSVLESGASLSTRVSIYAGPWDGAA
jgi:hypothetical protein